MTGVVDADTHVLEPQEMWENFDDGGEMYSHRPLLVNLPGDTSWGGRNAFWLIDGEMYPKSAGRNTFPLHTPTTAVFETERTDIAVGARQMTDVPARLKDMDERGLTGPLVCDGCGRLFHGIGNHNRRSISPRMDHSWHRCDRHQSRSKAGPRYFIWPR